MRARRPARRAFPGTAAAVLACAALAGCSGGPGGSSAGATAPSGSSSPAGQAAGASKLTGNFCTDFKNSGSNMPIPPAASTSLSTLVQRDSRYLRQVSAYYDRLAAEAPPQAGQDVRIIGSAYQALAGSIANGNTGSFSKIEQQITALTSSGTASKAFRQLVGYVTSKCA